MSKANVENKPLPTSEDFVAVWNFDESVKTPGDVAKALTAKGFHITVPSVYARQKSYTKAGVNLRDLVKGQGKGRKLDVAKLNAISKPVTAPEAPAEKAVA